MTAENDTVLIKVELLHINLKLKFLLQISPISKLFNVFLSNFDQGTFFALTITLEDNYNFFLPSLWSMTIVHWYAQFILDLFVDPQQFVDYCPWEVELKLKPNFGLLGGEKDNQRCASRKNCESICHGGKSNHQIK